MTITVFKLIILTIFALGLLAIDFLGYSIMPKKTYRQASAAFAKLICLYLITVILVIVGFNLFIA